MEPEGGRDFEVLGFSFEVLSSGSEILGFSSEVFGLSSEIVGFSSVVSSVVLTLAGSGPAALTLEFSVKMDQPGFEPGSLGVGAPTSPAP